MSTLGWKVAISAGLAVATGALVYALLDNQSRLQLDSFLKQFKLALPESTQVEAEVDDLEVIEEKEQERVKIIYASETGSAQRLAAILASLLPAKSQILAIQEYENEDLFKETSPVIFVLSTYAGGNSSKDAQWFNTWIDDVRQDVRVGAEALNELKYAVFGVGDSAYKDEFCKFGIKVDQLLNELGGKRLAKVGLGDLSNDFQELNDFAAQVSLKLIHNIVEEPQKPELIYSDDEATENEDEDEQNLLDIEDIGPGMKNKVDTTIKEMVTPNLRKSLEKQRYKIVGTHSGVKICRWTKSMLRGRGGCYKHSFYGIASHQCMESTPSLACANKCVFCWRSHTNPVGTEWKWKIDDPNEIVQGAMNGHYAMIKSLKGVPGVIKERFDEGMQIRHCALSLVGEPIMFIPTNLGILESMNC